MFQKAVRKRAKARIGICGPAGSGKTMSALKLAFGIVGPAGKIAVIDTENESASLYAHLGDYHVAVIKPPFTVEKYISGIKEAGNLGYDLIIIDSLSHAWAGTGGILEFVDARTESAKGNKFAGWREATPKHNSLVDAMLQSPLHVIATMRSKTEYVLVEDEKGKKVPQKVGMAPVQREGMEYELTLIFDVDQERHIATSSKDQTGIFDGFFGKLTEEHGRSIREWLDSREVALPTTDRVETQQPSPPQFIRQEQGDRRSDSLGGGSLWENNLEGNGEGALAVTGTEDVAAPGNWWGSPHQRTHQRRSGQRHGAFHTVPGSSSELSVGLTVALFA